jgi:hypothetical protein
MNAIVWYLPALLLLMGVVARWMLDVGYFVTQRTSVIRYCSFSHQQPTIPETK